MRRFIIATTLAVAFAPGAALDAAAATGVVTPKKHDLTCTTRFAHGTSYVFLRNTTGRTIPNGAQIAVVTFTETGGTLAVRRAVTVPLPLKAGNRLIRETGTTRIKSCSASVQLLPDVTRR
jgi:hypothetical protein